MTLAEKELRCVHGNGILNTFGGWKCLCPTDRLLMSIGNTTYPMYRCQGSLRYTYSCVSDGVLCCHISHSGVVFFVDFMCVFVFVRAFCRGAL